MPFAKAEMEKGKKKAPMPLPMTNLIVFGEMLPYDADRRKTHLPLNGEHPATVQKPSIINKGGTSR